MKTLLLVGALLFTISAPPLALMAREFWIGARVTDRYSVDRVISRERGMEGGAIRDEIHGHVVALEDDQQFNEVGDVPSGGASTDPGRWSRLLLAGHRKDPSLATGRDPILGIRLLDEGHRS